MALNRNSRVGSSAVNQREQRANERCLGLRKFAFSRFTLAALLRHLLTFMIPLWVQSLNCVERISYTFDDRGGWLNFECGRQAVTALIMWLGCSEP